MKTQDLRKEAFLCGLAEKSEEVVSRILDVAVEVPEARGNFYITVNGIALCAVDEAFSGDSESVCEFESLHDSIGSRARVKAAFPAATVAVVAGTCPGKSHEEKAA